ncbi:AAA family ATPase [Flavobacterium sp. LC2016-12]|uniref:AAA family ATPase n=1 Tax=Flavobacterium sp. LC2016-12 TaxID=2783794 RepID=UPI00188D9AD2|nr:AAA family ATPase [Flavobacterium sp. LC2016-12]MBF4465006.1 AAA family ATPase [Flavobacterium sp. LC2016-12]
MKFNKLIINDWKQFEKIEIDFHPNLTVLTGANGSGKTTVLNLLARHFGWTINELATPAKDEKTGFFRFFSRWFKTDNEKSSNELGLITYSNDVKSSLVLPTNNDQAQYNIQITNMQEMKGLNIPSHRPVFFYQPVPHISTQKRTKEQAYQLAYQSSFYKNYSENSGMKTTNYYIKETLLNWAMGGNGNEFIEPDHELREHFIGFEKILLKILPESIGFEKISIRNYEIVLITKTGEFMLDAVSGGISAIIDLGWQIFNYSGKENQQITVLIDEIENHLHATLQRSILPSIIEAFPNVQFIVSTHSPLIVGSVKDSNVYAFRYNQNNKIYNEYLDLINKAKNANEILNEVLGVPFSMPIWVENSLNDIVEKYSNSEISPDIFKAMRTELRELGLENLMPTAMDKTIEKLDGKN